MNYDLMNNNKLSLTGRIASPVLFTHEVLGESFFETTIEVKRLSGVSDVIPLTVSDRLMDERPITEGEEVTIEGQFRSHNKTDGDRSRLMLTAFARDVIRPALEGVDPNSLEVCGYICKPPVYRVTPFNREICDILLAVNRAYNKSDYIPCILWGRSARYAKDLKVGTKVSMKGRVQSRCYNKTVDGGEVEERVAYEFSVNRFKVEERVAEHDRAALGVQSTAKLF